MKTTLLRTAIWAACAATTLALVSVPVVQAKDAPPQVSEDGLQLTSSA